MLSYREHFRINFSIAYPVMLSQLGHIMVSVADSMMVGRVGVVPLGGASLGNMIMSILITFGIGISYGATPLVAAADGSRDMSGLSSILRHSLIINILAGIILFLIVLTGKDILWHLDQPEDVVAEAIPYLLVISASMIPLMVFQSYRQFLEGLANTRPAMFVSVGVNILNIILNYILIFGKLGFEPMGLLGAGVATLIARVIMAVTMIAIARKSMLYKKNKVSIRGIQLSFNIYKRILNIGIPSAFQYFFEVATFAAAVVMMGWLGKIHLAAHQIAINLAAVTYMMAMGLGAAAMVRAGNQLGKQDYTGLRRASNSILAMVIVFMSTTAIIFIAFRFYLPAFYIDNDLVIEKAATLLIIAALFQLSDGLQVVTISLLRGIKDTKIPTAIVFISYVLVGLPIAYILGFYFDLEGVGIWLGLFAGLTTAAIILLIRFIKLRRKLKISLS